MVKEVSNGSQNKHKIFSGLSGPVIMNEQAERLQTYAASRILSNNTFSLVLVVDLNVSCFRCDVMQYNWVRFTNIYAF
jgi:hypothetical protein